MSDINEDAEVIGNPLQCGECNNRAFDVMAGTWICTFCGAVIASEIAVALILQGGDDASA